ncbi:MAG: hypothetical protein K0V04_15450 [Deltaproteobacteria bacterium]|nr:hypothetical protein [Deltaproteobacteria bacterium]
MPGCFDPPEPSAGTETDGATGTATDVATSLPTMGGATDPDTTAADTSPTGACSAQNAIDPTCDDATPYCVDGTCVDCSALSCADVDGATPACDPGTGLCVECTDGDQTACADTNYACIDSACAPCTDNAQCASEVCLSAQGECLIEEIDVVGTVFDYSQIAPTPVADVTVRVTNLSELPTSGPTPADGGYSLDNLVFGTLLDIELQFPQDDPVFVPATISPRQAFRVPNDDPAPLDLQLVTYAWMAQVAFECGFFATLEEATGTNAVNPYFINRSTVFGQLVDDNGDGVAAISRAAIRAEVQDWTNFETNLLDTDANPTRVCFLDEDPVSGTYVGTTDLVSNDTGRFVMFRLRNDTGVGQGPVAIRSTGFDDAFVNLSSSGNIGVVELVRNDEVILRDFAIDIYPVFQSYNCVLCHTAGGPPEAVHDGIQADWDLPPRQVWDNMVGPGTVCMNPAEPERVCTNDPELSLFVTRPLTDMPGMPDVHPIDIFPSIEDPMLQVIIEWIEQGALPPTDVRFEQDIYPLFQQHACVACHINGGPPEAVNMGFAADWSLSPFEVWENLTGPGTTCPDPANPVRICTDNVLSSLLVTNPLTDEVGMPDNHPVDAFNTTDDPDMQLIIQWIAQGAQFEVSCEHSECVEGAPLNPGCSVCVSEVCGSDPFCCNTMWDNQCVGEAQANPNCGC